MLIGHLHSLRNKLPFEDEEFDYVHIQNLALGIPENKVRRSFISQAVLADRPNQWYSLYEVSIQSLQMYDHD